MTIKMTALERRAVFSLATILSLRMLGLFMVLPLFSLYAHELIGSTPFLIGIALGIYGLSQAICQIPFGMLSDIFGRRKIITIGLLLFILGSLIAAMAHTIEGMIVGRILQGMGAIGSTLMAMLADMTSLQRRTFAMAISGMAIGLSFLVSMMLGPLLATYITISGLFFLAALFALLGIVLLFTWVPTPQKEQWHSDVEPAPKDFFALLCDSSLWPLNSGIFFLHMIFTASFVVIPVSLHAIAGLSSTAQGWIYCPILILAFLLSLPALMISEKKHAVKLFFITGIILLGIAEILFWIFAKNLWISLFGLLLFLSAFSLLEAFLPSLVSRTAPASRKGTALGLYSCSQFLGIFVGGLMGGWLYGQFGLIQVYLFCVILTLIWVIIAFKMNTGDSYHGKR